MNVDSGIGSEGDQSLYRPNSSQAVALLEPYLATRSAIVDLSATVILVVVVTMISNGEF